MYTNFTPYGSFEFNPSTHGGHSDPLNFQCSSPTFSTYTSHCCPFQVIFQNQLRATRGHCKSDNFWLCTQHTLKAISVFCIHVGVCFTVKKLHGQVTAGYLRSQREVTSYNPISKTNLSMFQWKQKCTHEPVWFLAKCVQKFTIGHGIGDLVPRPSPDLLCA